MTVTTAEAPPSFSEWLATATATDDPTGDLVLDLRDDGRKPPITSGAALCRYLRSRQACRGALAAARKVWQRYRSEVMA